MTVVDRGPVGGGTTAAGMGHVVVMDDSDAQVALTAYSQKLWDERGPTLPAAGEHMVCGTLWVAADDEEMAEVERERAFYHDRGIVAEVLDARPAGGGAEPAGRAARAGRFDDLPPPIAAAMLDTVRRRGSDVRLGRSVVSIDGHAVRFDDATTLTRHVLPPLGHRRAARAAVRHGRPRRRATAHDRGGHVRCRQSRRRERG